MNDTYLLTTKSKKGKNYGKTILPACGFEKPGLHERVSGKAFPIFYNE